MLINHTNRHDYKQLIYIMNEDDEPEFGIPVSVDLSEWLTPKIANRLFDLGFVYPNDFFAKSGLHQHLFTLYRDENTHLDRHQVKLQINLIIEEVRSVLS